MEGRRDASLMGLWCSSHLRRLGRHRHHNVEGEGGHGATGLKRIKTVKKLPNLDQKESKNLVLCLAGKGPVVLHRRAAGQEELAPNQAGPARRVALLRQMTHCRVALLKSFLWVNFSL